MTAIRVIDTHDELQGSGQTSHDKIDGYLINTGFLVVSGSVSTNPPSARRLVAGPGVTITDGGPGGLLTISTTVAIGASIAWNEVPSGSLDGVNTVFTLANPPFPPASLMLFVNGQKLKQGPTEDFILSGSTITIAYAPRSSFSLEATYPF